MDIGSIGNITVEVDGLKFTLRPREYSDMLYWRGKIKEFGIEDEETQALGFGLSDTMLRIVDWEGIESGGEKAPCTMRNKNALFSRHPDLFNKIAAAVSEQEGLAEKNSETSQAGKTTGTPGPAKRAQK